MPQNTDHAEGIAPALSADMLDAMAARLRPIGLFLMMLRPDGTVIYADRRSAGLFMRYVLPMVEIADRNCPSVRKALTHGADGGTAETFVCDAMPGILMAMAPHGERRRLDGVLLLAAKSESFALTEEVLRCCGQLGLDAGWLDQQAKGLPGFWASRMMEAGKLLVGMLGDQTKVGGLQREMDSLSAQLANAYEELSLIYQISGGMKINRAPDEFFRQACLDVMDVIGARGVGVSLQGAGLPGGRAAIYGEVSLSEAVTRKLADELVEALQKRPEAIIINDLSADARFGWVAPFASRMIAVPLQRQEHVLGCLFGFDKASGEFDSVDLKLLGAIANQSAIYLENARLYEDVHDLMMGLLHSLTSAVDAKDAYTCGHSERVALLSRHLASRAGLGAGEVDRIYMAGLLHDVGKIGVPESVLQKTGKLTDAEFEEMKKHPQIGARILRDIKQVADIIPGVLHHHERYDGRGYPGRLAGDNIPLMGRIICLADCFDAMTSNRTYRKALPLEVALMEIRRCAGTQFDPYLAEHFVGAGVEHYRKLLSEQDQHTQLLADLQQSLRASAA